MNTPALLIVLFVVLYTFVQAAAWHTITQAMAGKFTKFSVNMWPTLVIIAIGLVLAYLADANL